MGAVERDNEVIDLRLEHAPLARVLCQARWPQVSGFQPAIVADRLADAIGDAYPVREDQQELQVTITPQGVTSGVGGTLFRFLSKDRSWAATLHESFLALETSRYIDHRDFITRFGVVFDSLLAAVPRLPYIARLGYRYTNRIVEADDLERLAEYFVPGILGSLAEGRPPNLVHSINESVYRDGEHFLQVRSAMVGPNAAIEPTLPPVDSPSWVLDLDAYDEGPMSGYSVDNVRGQATELADRARLHFRSLITPAFEERFR